MMKEAIGKLIDGQGLTEAEAEAAMLEIMDGLATPAQIGSYVTALRMKGETVEEITGSARAMRARATRIRPNDPIIVDTCGTGGDGAGTFNVSTTVAFVLAGPGITVAKHGNRAVASRARSADTLAPLGGRRPLPSEDVQGSFPDIRRAF